VIHIIGPRSVNFAWRTHFIGHLRAINNNFLDTYQLKTQNMVLDATIRRIDRAGSKFIVTLSYSRRNKTVRLAYDRVITCTGFRMDASIFDESCRPELTIDGRFPALTSEWESVNVPDLYFAGTLTQSRDYKKHTSAFIHGFRYGTRALHRMLERRYEATEWPHRDLPADPMALTNAVLDRANRSSGLWQQYAFLCDLIGFTPSTPSNDGAGARGACRYHEEVPVDHILDGGFGVTARFFTVTLEYGAGHDTIDPFDIDVGRAWEADPAHEEDRYLHPVVRYYVAGELDSVLHLPEDVCNDWSGETTHSAPLHDFFASATGRMVAPPAPRLRRCPD
jgi:Pyridine nucleotide-disulphide oxidoreductase